MAKQKNGASAGELWQSLGGGAKAILEGLGYSYIPTDHNPIWLGVAGLDPLTEEDIQELVEDGELSEQEADGLRQVKDRGKELADKICPFLWRGTSPNKSAIFEAYALCQTACLNEVGGPIGNRSLGSIRQRWYFAKVAEAMGFKYAAQAFEKAIVKTADVVLVDDDDTKERAMGALDVRLKTGWKKADAVRWEEIQERKPKVHIRPKSGWGRSYAQLQSGILGDLVRGGLTYEALWVRDASRKVETASAILPDFYGVLVIEKEGLFEHMAPLAQAAGVPVLIAMAGNNAFSVVEAVLNDNFRGWEGDYRPTPANPLHLLCISDHDYYGIVPVQAGVAEQFERYLPGAVEVHRVGVTPQQVRDAGRSPVQAGYVFDWERNSATDEWAHDPDGGIWVGDTLLRH